MSAGLDEKQASRGPAPAPTGDFLGQRPSNATFGSPGTHDSGEMDGLLPAYRE